MYKLIVGTILFVSCATSLVCAQWCRRVGATAPCSILGSESIVFVGTVLGITPERRSHNLMDGTNQEYWGSRVQFRIDELISGALGTEVELTAGEGGDYRFEAGRRYLVDASSRDGGIVAEQCSLTAPIEHADHILEQLKRVKQGRSAASIYGLLIQREDYPYRNYASFDRTLKEVVLRLHSEEHEFSTKTGADGSFSFYDLPTGKYVASADLPQGYVLQSDRELNVFRVDKGACLLDNLTAIPNGSVSGLVTDADGVPMQHADVELKTPFFKTWQRDDQDLRTEKMTLLRDTDEEGRFEFSELPDGKFNIVVSSDLSVQRRTPYQPYKRAIHIVGGNSVDIGVVSLHKWKDQYTARFLVLWKDGTPAKGAAVSYEESGDSSEDEKDVDADGRVSLQFLSEYRYKVHAIMRCKRGWVESAPRTVKSAGAYKLVLDDAKCETAEY